MRACVSAEAVRPARAGGRLPLRPFVALRDCNGLRLAPLGCEGAMLSDVYGPARATGCGMQAQGQDPIPGSAQYALVGPLAAPERGQAAAGPVLTRVHDHPAPKPGAGAVVSARDIEHVSACSRIHLRTAGFASVAARGIRAEYVRATLATGSGRPI